jgi:hypothetical protein
MGAPDGVRFQVSFCLQDENEAKRTTRMKLEAGCQAYQKQVIYDKPCRVSITFAGEQVTSGAQSNSVMKRHNFPIEFPLLIQLIPDNLSSSFPQLPSSSDSIRQHLTTDAMQTAEVALLFGTFPSLVCLGGSRGRPHHSRIRPYVPILALSKVPSAASI